ncbi:malate synthase A [Streptomyces erythrochromogenes]|uniref:malate synthase A n=1 Tax=Streptomyces erythrochromogenes TaxID=285574 RepID=UPI0033F5313A
MSPTHTPTRRVKVLGPPGDRHGEILTPAALDFLARLDEAFAGRRREILTARRHRSDRLASGSPLDFPRATSAVRDDPHWRVAPPAPGLTDRRVEITAPPTPRMAVNALNSGARVWMADFEDATSQHWENVVGGQLTLLDACRGRLDFTGPEGKEYRVGPDLPTVMVRPRGWHLEEEHLTVDGRPLSASLVDFGLYFFHCAQRRIDVGSGPYFSLPKLENRYEARLWNDVFVFAQDLLGIPRGTLRATATIETVTAAFEMEEILYELREHSAGLNAGRWDYLFSLIKTFGHRARFLLPDRTEITMTAPFMRAYAELLVRTCHRRGAHAIGGVAAHLPATGAVADPAAAARVRLDKECEARAGFDGSWVAHPALVPVCREVFDLHLGGGPHQIHRPVGDVPVRAADLLSVRRSALPPGTEQIRSNVAVALRYFDAWLRGRGAVALDGLLEDTATAEIARARLWQWLRHRVVTQEELFGVIDAEAAALAAEQPGALAAEAREILERTLVSRELPDHFTTEAYRRHLVRRTEASS